MKKFILSMALVLLLCLALGACTGGTEEKDLWSDAVYTQDTELGEGGKLVSVKVVAEEKSVVFTLHTDKEILGDALMEHNLIAGEEGPYGLYVKKVNGILADYDQNQSFWSLCQEGEPLTVGVDGAQIQKGDTYELIYTK